MAKINDLPSKSVGEASDTVLGKTESGSDVRLSLETILNYVKSNLTVNQINASSQPLSTTLTLPKSGDITSQTGVTLFDDNGTLKFKQAGSDPVSESVASAPSDNFPDLSIDPFETELTVGSISTSVVRGILSNDSFRNYSRLLQMSENVWVFAMPVTSLRYRGVSAIDDGESGSPHYKPSGNSVIDIDSLSGVSASDDTGLQSIGLWRITRDPTDNTWSIATPDFVVPQEIQKETGVLHLRSQKTTSPFSEFHIQRLSDDIVFMSFRTPSTEYAIDSSFDTREVTNSNDSRYQATMMYDVTNQEYFYDERTNWYTNFFWQDKISGIVEQEDRSGYGIHLCGVAQDGSVIRAAGISAPVFFAGLVRDSDNFRFGHLSSSGFINSIYNITLSTSSNDAASHNFNQPSFERIFLKRPQFAPSSSWPSKFLTFDAVKNQLIFLVNNSGYRYEMNSTRDNFLRDSTSTTSGRTNSSNPVGGLYVRSGSDIRYEKAADAYFSQYDSNDRSYDTITSDTNGVRRTRRVGYRGSFPSDPIAVIENMSSLSYQQAYPMVPAGIYSYAKRDATAGSGYNFYRRNQGFTLEFKVLGDTFSQSFPASRSIGIATGDTSGDNVTAYLLASNVIIQGLENIVPGSNYYLDSSWCHY